ncbi:ScbR family autoregulator-binding transcription factor [Streptomyces sp. NPDC050658]|uniref:ScbR family autoregulator-binding transcription factor n=1 Tax=unclassified Streptomyces TaxID=2593676 RepID=UPI00343D61B3
MVARTLKQERAERTRATLVRAGAEVFAKCGFAGASVTRIAEQAGLTLGAMYFHFKSKEDLAREIVMSQPDMVVPPVSAQGLQRVIDVTLTWAYQLREDPLLQAGARLVMDQESFLESNVNSHRQWMGILVADLKDARRRRELRAGVDVDRYARLIVSACTGAQMHAQMESSRRDLPQRIEEMWECLLPAIAVPSAAKKMQFGEERGKAQ